MELGPNARNLIDLARHEDDPNDATRERALARLNANLAAGSAPLMDAGSPHAAGDSSGAESIAAKALFGFKGTILLAVAVVATGGGLALHSQDAGPRAASVAASSHVTLTAHAPEPDTRAPSGPAPSAPGEEPVSNLTTKSPVPTSSSRQAPAARPSPEASSAFYAGPAVAVGEVARIDTGRSERKEVPSTERGEVRAEHDASGASLLVGEQSTRAAASSPERPAGPSAPDALLAEARALRDAQQALRAGQSKRALALLAEQEHRFPNGQLREARAAARAMASCMNAPGAGRPQIAAAFEARWSRSPMLSSVRAACGLNRTGAELEE